MLSDKESEEMEKLLAKNPELQARLQVLKNQSLVIGKRSWQRVLLDRGSRRGSRTRYTTLLPALLMLMVVLMVTRHWFARPGENSTFTMTGGNGSGLELLYNSKSGWRYLDAGFQPSDSLSISIRDTGTVHVAVIAIYGHGPEAEATIILPDAADQIFSHNSPKPVFTLSAASAASPQHVASSHLEEAPSQIVVLYDVKPLPTLNGPLVLDIVASQGNERGGLDFKFQVFSAGR